MTPASRQVSELPFDPLGFVRATAPWLAAPELGTCVVGSQALALACQFRGLPPPVAGDLDLAWAPDVASGEALLRSHGVFVPTTAGNQARGTLALMLGGQRIEITTLRGGSADLPLQQRIAADLDGRDMTIGAVAVEVATGRIHDPHGGIDDFGARRIAPVGDPAQRVREHPVRWLRYFRKAHELGFALAGEIRRLQLDPGLLHTVPAEAVALELRALLLRCASPGRCLLELHEARLLEALAPELARQFDGRPAGPQRWHPEVSQALHLILALEWVAAMSRDLDERDRLAVRFAVLCHDLGKGYTAADRWPQHHGHEAAGPPHVERLARRWPGLADLRAVRLARDVALLHLTVQRFAALRPGTLAALYEDHFRAADYPVALFALAVAADVAGRLGNAAEGEAVRSTVARDLAWLRQVCSAVDAAALRQRHGDDIAGFRAALHEARAQALAAVDRPR